MGRRASGDAQWVDGRGIAGGGRQGARIYVSMRTETNIQALYALPERWHQISEPVW